MKARSLLSELNKHCKDWPLGEKCLTGQESNLLIDDIGCVSLTCNLMFPNPYTCSYLRLYLKGC